MTWAALLPALVKAGVAGYGAYSGNKANNENAANIIAANNFATGQAYEGAVYNDTVNRRLTTLAYDSAGRLIDANNAAYETDLAALNAYADQQFKVMQNVNKVQYDQYGRAIDAYGQLIESGAPGIDYQQRVIAEDGQLSDLQNYYLDQVREDVTNAVRNSSLSGSGRATAELFRDVENDYILKAQDQNRRAAAAAAGQLAAGFQTGVTGTAQAATNYGNAYARTVGDYQNRITDAQLRAGELAGERERANAGIYSRADDRNAAYQQDSSEAYQDVYKTSGDNRQSSATTGAQANTANAKLTGQAIGETGAAIINYQRESRYADRYRKLQDQRRKATEL